MHIKQVYFVLWKQEEHISSSSFRHFVPKDQNKLCTHDKNWKRVELWVKINVFNVFVMYALDSAHVKVRRLNRSRSFAVLFDKPGRIERQVDPNTNLSNPIDSNEFDSAIVCVLPFHIFPSQTIIQIRRFGSVAQEQEHLIKIQLFPPRKIVQF